MNIVFFDCHHTRQNLLPLTFTRPIADLRVGILTIREKWEFLLKSNSWTLTVPYLALKYPSAEDKAPALFINGSVLPHYGLIEAIHKLGALQVLVKGKKILAFKTEKQHLNYENFEAIARGFTPVEYDGDFSSIEHTWNIFQMNGTALADDFKLITKDRVSQPVSETNTVIGPVENLFLEEGAKAEACIINCSGGPVYIGKQAELMEGCVIRGPLALCEGAALKLNTKVYGPTTLGPHCKAGGELNNTVMFGYSNKAHDGFLGNSVIGEWCNLGADTNNSNLKNNYSNVDVFSYKTGTYEDTGLTFCGLVMGDHSKCGINTMFNTGTVVGVFANIFGGDFPPKFIPSFSWGGNRWLRTFSFEKSMEVAEKVMERRGIKLSQVDIDILKTIYDLESKFRKD